MDAIHTRTGVVYTIISENHRVKIDGRWYKAVLYEVKNDPDVTLTFSRIVEDFDRNFIKVKPKVGKRQDGIQLC